MKYILLVVLMADYGGYSSAIRNFERTPVMFGGLFKTEGECMAAARRSKSSIYVNNTPLESFCVSANGWEQKEKPDDPFTPFGPFTPVK